MRLPAPGPVILPGIVPTNSTPPKINVEHHAERGDRTEQAKQHIESALHARCFENADRASNQTTENSETHHRLGAGTAFRCRALILCLCGHKKCVTFQRC